MKAEKFVPGWAGSMSGAAVNPELPLPGEDAILQSPKLHVGLRGIDDIVDTPPFVPS